MTIKLPGYRIIREIGAGGFGRVFQAKEERTGNTVAVKILQTSRGQAFRRFRREGKALWRNLTNPHVVTLIEQDFDGFWPYLVMEFCPGGSLREWVTERRSWQEVATALVHTSRGLSEFHRAGGSHRDIKPDNLFLAQDGNGYWVVKVGDFGLARSPEIVSELMTDTPCGTMGYWAPEVQARQPYTNSVDIYSLGITGIELLTGRRDPAGLNDALAPSKLVELLRRMTATDPEARPHVEEVEQQIIRILNDAPAAPQRRLERKWYPWIFAGATGLLVFVVAGIVLLVNRKSLLRASLDVGLAVLKPPKAAP